MRRDFIHGALGTAVALADRAKEGCRMVSSSKSQRAKRSTTVLLSCVVTSESFLGGYSSMRL